MRPSVFIDGEYGTTGLRVRRRLSDRSDIRLISIDPKRRRDPAARHAHLNEADAVVLCLPDPAAREAVAMVENEQVRIIDASTAHRVAGGWVYGFAEMTPGQSRLIAASRRVANPGCYPTGFVALVRPLVEGDLVPADWPVTVNAVSGYSGGGQSMIDSFEHIGTASHTDDVFRLYALGMAHKHVPEMQRYALLARPPLFAPAVGRWRQGMIVEVPLQLWALPGAPARSDVHGLLARAYEGEGGVEVASLEEADAIETLDPEGLNDTDRMKLMVFGSDQLGQVRLVALLDNLGKGASGAAIQNLELMLGLGECARPS